MTRDESRAGYAIIRHNIRTYLSDGVVAVIRGKENAEAMVKSFEQGQSSEDRWTGWRYFLEKTEIKPGTDPRQATSLRQNELETRESKALDEPPTLASDFRPIRN